MMPVISALLDGVLMLIVENGNLHETRNPCSYYLAKLPSYTEPDGIAQRHSLLPHSGKQQVIRKAVFCAVTCVWSRIKSNFLFTLPLTLPVYFEQITRCLSASLFRVGHSGQVSTVQHSGCFGRGVTSLIFRDVNISKQHPQLSTQLLVGLKRWL